jgi:hypothetical protein
MVAFLTLTQTKVEKLQRTTGRTDQWRSYVNNSVQLSAPIHSTQTFQTNPLSIFGTIATRPTKMLIDSGASLTLIISKLFFQLSYYIRRRTRYPTNNLQLYLADKSCLHVQRTRRKLQPLYLGPCRIIEQLTPSTFIVQRVSDNVNLGTINADRLRLYYKPITESQQSNSTSNLNQPTTHDTPSLVNLHQTSSSSNNQTVQCPPSTWQRTMPGRYLF